MNNPIEALRHSRYGVPISREEHAEFQRAVTPHAPTVQRSDGTYLNETTQRMFYLWLHAVDWALGACVRGVLQPAASPAPSASASPAAPGFVLVPVEPITGERYENGEWSRRNWEAALADQGAAPVAGSQQVPEGFALVPVEPTPEMIYQMSAEMWPEDWNAGREAQRRLGLDAIPPRTEYECAYGKYQRVLAAAPAVPVPAEQDQVRDAARWRWFVKNGFFWRGENCLQTCWPKHGEIGVKDPQGGSAKVDAINASIDAEMAAPSLQQPKEGAAE